ncbi:LPS export ABC transporter permease LptF [Candidatus Regiella endosymbiont of Tuberolachnus salignus]|uniref:LPS export ABC transporter permease LptF n=1 Tax=Candidatus Regiella endosymbiont of Tuberolachnus salignus TaxID=3077956 RepID=UPI0030CAEC5C
MIIIKYIIKKTFKSQMAILFILLLIFISQKLIVILSETLNGEIPTHLILSFLGLGLPEMAQLVLPLSLFLGLLITYGKMYTEREITVMHACGFSQNSLILVALILAMGTAALAAINTLWFMPWSVTYQGKILNDFRANPTLAALIEGQFQSSMDGKTVLFVGAVDGKKFDHIFLAQLRPDGSRRPSIVIAENGYIAERPDGSQIVTLDRGTRYEGTALLRDFRITDFKNYQVTINPQSITQNTNTSEQMSIRSLWHSSHPDARSEFHWRLTLITSVIIMALLAVPLSVVNPRQSRTLNMLPAILLYLIFFLLQSSLRSSTAQGKLDPLLWLWMVNGAYFALAIVLNKWDSLMSNMRVVFSRFLRGAN